MGSVSSFKNSFSHLVRGRNRVLYMTLLVLLPLIVVFVGALCFSFALDQTNRIPVAVVNLDKGCTTDDGVKVHAGQDVVDTLEDNDDLAWDFVDEATADAGLEDGTYALVVKIPADYSQDVESVNTNSPSKAVINIVSSGAENILATRVGSATLKQVQAQLKRDLGENYLLSVLSSVNGQASKLTLAADGAVMLDQGYDALSEGAIALGEGLDQVASGAEALGSGTSQIASGVDALGTGAQAVATGLDTVNTQLVEPLGAGAQALATGLDTMGTATQGMGMSLVEIGGALTQLGQGISADNEDVAALSVVAPQLSASSGSLARSLVAAREAAGRVSDSAALVTSKLDNAQAKAKEMSSDATKLACTLDSSQETEVEQHAGVKQQLEQIDAQIDAVTETVTRVAEAMGQADAADNLPNLKAQLDAAVAQLQALKDMRATLSQNVATAASSAVSLADAAHEVDSSLDDAADARAELVQAQDAYASATKQMDADAQQVVSLAGQVVKPAMSVLVNLLTVQRALVGSGQVGEEAYVPGLGESVIQIGQGVAYVGSELTSTGSVGAGASGLALGVSSLTQALSPMSTAIAGIGTGASALSSALSGVGAGVSGLGSGITAMAQASSGIGSGIGQLKDASAQLTDVMDYAGEKLSNISSNSSDRAKVAANPLSFNASNVHAQRSVFTSAAAPAFATALWCGILAASALLPALDVRRVMRGRTLRAVIVSFIPLLLVSLVQAGLLSVAALCMGISGQSLAWTGLVLAVSAVAIATIQQLLRIMCNRYAVPVSLSVLVLQLCAAGALLPSSMAVDILSVFTFLPVPQLSCALRHVFAGAVPASGVFIAAGIVVVVALLLSMVFALRRRVLRPERLRLV